MMRAVAESVDSPPGATVRPFPGPWAAGADAYRTLDVVPGARPDEILRAYMRLRRALRSDSPALAPLACETERIATVAEVERAFRRLSSNLSVPAPLIGDRAERCPGSPPELGHPGGPGS